MSFRLHGALRVFTVLVGTLVLILMTLPGAAAAGVRLQPGDQTVFYWTGSSQELKGTFRIQADQAIKPFQVIAEGISQPDANLFPGNEVTVEGPDELAKDLSATYMFTVKNPPKAGAYILSFLAQWPGGSQAFTLPMLVVTAGEGELGLNLDKEVKRANYKDAEWTVPLKLVAPSPMTEVTYSAGALTAGSAQVLAAGAVQVKAKEGKGEADKQLGPIPQDLSLVLQGVDPGNYRITLTASGTGAPVMKYTVPVTLPKVTVTPPEGGYKVEYVMPFLSYYFYRWRNAFDTPVEALSVPFAQPELRDGARHRVLPEGQLKLLVEGGDQRGTAFVEVSDHGNQRLLTMAVKPDNPDIVPGAYTGKVSIGGNPVQVTVNVKHPITTVFLLALLGFVIPTFVEWLRSQSDRSKLWAKFTEMGKPYAGREQPAFMDHFRARLMLDIMNPKKKVAEIEPQVALGLRLAASPAWEKWMLSLDPLDNEASQPFWEKLHEALQPIPADAKTDDIHQAVIKVLHEAEVDATIVARLEQNKPQVPEVRKTPGLAFTKMMISAGATAAAAEVKWYKPQDWRWFWQSVIARSLGNVKFFLQITLWVGALIGVFWQTYKQYESNPTFGADWLKDYGLLLATVLGVNITQQVITNLIGLIPQPQGGGKNDGKANA